MNTLRLKRLGTSLKDMRKRRGLTQAAVADLAGVPRLKVIQVERGTSGVAIEAYSKVADALGGELTLGIARLPTLEEARAFFDDDE